MSRSVANVETPLVLTLDVGTSSTRAMLFDRMGRAVEGVRASVSYDVRTTPDGGAELDADELFEHCLRCIEGVLTQAGDWKRHIAGVAMDTLWHSILGVDEGGRAATPFYLWADTRSRKESEELKRRLDEREVHARTGCLFHPSYVPAKLLWIHRYRPEQFRRAKRWMSFGEYLLLRLFGQMVCSYSMASGTGLFDNTRLDWDDEVISVLPIDREQLSPLADFNTPLVSIKSEFAQRLEALGDVPWFPALGDGACSNIGSGCVSPQRFALMVGTSGAMRVMMSEGEPRPPWGLWCYRADARRHLFGGALSNGGIVFEWMTETLRLGKQDIERELAAMEPDAHGLTVLPFLLGERSPNWRADATAAIVGLRLSTKPIEILRAGLEAVAYRFALIHELLCSAVPGTHDIIATGAGLLRSPTWCQIMADVLGQPVIASKEPEASSRGTALMALEALGVLRDLTDAPAQLGETYQPNPAHQELYLAAMERQRRLYAMLIG